MKLLIIAFEAPTGEPSYPLTIAVSLAVVGVFAIIALTLCLREMFFKKY